MNPMTTGSVRQPDLPPVGVLVHLRPSPQPRPDDFEAYLRTERGVVQAWHTSGDIEE